MKMWKECFLYYANGYRDQYQINGALFCEDNLSVLYLQQKMKYSQLQQQIDGYQKKISTLEVALQQYKEKFGSLDESKVSSCGNMQPQEKDSS